MGSRYDSSPSTSSTDTEAPSGAPLARSSVPLESVTSAPSVTSSAPPPPPSVAALPSSSVATSARRAAAPRTAIAPPLGAALPEKVHETIVRSIVSAAERLVASMAAPASEVSTVVAVVVEPFVPPSPLPLAAASLRRRPAAAAAVAASCVLLAKATPSATKVPAVTRSATALPASVHPSISSLPPRSSIAGASAEVAPRTVSASRRTCSCASAAPPSTTSTDAPRPPASSTASPDPPEPPEPPEMISSLALIDALSTMGAERA